VILSIIATEDNIIKCWAEKGMPRLDDGGAKSIQPLPGGQRLKV
jgi:hypothetical protein